MVLEALLRVLFFIDALRKRYYELRMYELRMRRKDSLCNSFIFAYLCVTFFREGKSSSPSLLSS